MYTVTIPTGHISDCCAKACREARLRGTDVLMTFNDTTVVVEPNMTPEHAKERWLNERIEQRRGVR